MLKKSSARAVVSLGVATALLVSACGGGSSSSTSSSSGSSGSQGVSATTITLGYITSQTGDASSTFADGAAGAQARVALQNADGGVDGRKIKLVVEDDQSSPTQDATAAQDLIGQKVFGVVDYSPFTFGGAKALQQADIPVTGYEFDGPEWAQQPYTNMFSFLPPFETPFDGKYYTWNYDGTFFKSVGVTKVAGLAYGDSPSAIASLKGELAAAKSVGIPTCYTDLSVPFGGVDFTASALAIKQAGCNGVTAPFVDASDVALSQAVKQSGINAKQLYGTGYDQSVITNKAANASFSGAYVENPISFTPANAATQTMLNALKTYDTSYKSGLPDYGLYGSYVSTDLMIKGLELAGKNPTRSTFMTTLRKDTNYTAEGMLPSPTSFADFGTSAMIPQTSCEYFFQLKGEQGFQAINGGKAICGKRLSYTS